MSVYIRNISCWAIGIAAVATGLTWVPLFGLANIWFVVGIAIVGPLSLSVIGQIRGWSLGFVTLVSAAALLVAGTYLLFWHTTVVGIPTWTTFTELTGSMWSGWGRILSSPAPAYPDPTMMFVPMNLLWSATQCAWEALRRGWLRLALVPLVPVWFIGIVLAAGTAGVNYLATVAFALAVVVALIAARQTSDSRRAPSLVGLVAVTLGVCLTTAALQPWDPRSIVEPPESQTKVEDPLAQLSQWNERPESVRVRATFTGSSDDLVLAVLDSYDGRIWGVDGGYRRAGQELPAAPTDWPTGEQTTAEITVDALGDTDWVPVVDRPETITDGTWLVNSETGMLRRTGDEGFPYSYTVAGRAPSGTDAASSGSAPATALIDEPMLPSTMPNSLIQLASRATQDADSERDRAQALAKWLRSSFPHNSRAASGSSLGHVRSLVEDNKASSETGFVAAYAVLARALGLPSRILITLDYATAVDGVIDGNSAQAVPQVWLGSGLGWQSFDPVPEEGEAPSSSPKELPQPETEEQQLNSVEQLDECEGCYEKVPSALPWWLLTALISIGVALVIGLLWVTVVCLAKRHRRRRRLASDPRSSVRGAFAEAVDGYLDARRFTLSADLTVSEVARRAQTSGPLIDLVVHADVAAYSPRVPTSLEVTSAWALADEALAELTASQSKPERARSVVSVRSWTERQSVTSRSWIKWRWPGHRTTTRSVSGDIKESEAVGGRDG